MDDFLRDYYTNELKMSAPGLACGDFKMDNNVGCFKLLVDKRTGRVSKLIYNELPSGKNAVIYDFKPSEDVSHSGNNVFIEKIFKEKLETSRALPDYEEVTLKKGQPSLRLVFFESSAVVFYWKGGKLDRIWTAD